MRLQIISPGQYTVNRLQHELVWQSYRRFRSFLELSYKQEEDLIEFLAEPHSRMGKIEWRTEYLLHPVPFNRLSAQDQTKCQNLVNTLLERFKQIAGENKQWSEFMHAAIVIDSFSDLFYDAELNRVVAVNWGASRDSAGTTDTYKFSLANKTPTVTPPPMVPGHETQTIQTDSDPVVQEVQSSRKHTDPPLSAQEAQVPKQETPQELRQESESAKYTDKTEPDSPVTGNQTPQESVDYALSEEANEKQEFKEVPSPSNQMSSVNAMGGQQRIPNLHENRRRRCKGWWKWLLGILLFLLLLLIVPALCKPNRTAYPLHPGVMVPIDPGDVGYSKDSIKIVLNRLNIYVPQKGETKAFMQAFVRLYPRDKFPIIYYDTIVQRIQVQVPPQERDLFKKEIPAKLSAFKPIVWDESIYDTGKTPSDPGFTRTDESWYFNCIHAYSAWDKTQGSEEILIGVVDGGFDLSHPELRDRVADQYNVYTGKHKVTAHRHGTHVAATVLGSADNASGVSGIAPQCKLIAVQVADENEMMSTTAIMDGIIYCILHGAKVVNVSLGKDLSFLGILSYEDQVNFIRTELLEEEEVWNQIYAMAEEYGCTVVLAGGNEHVLIGADPLQRSSRCIKVSAIDPNLEQTEFTNYGFMSTISAPGVHIYNAVPGGKYEFLDGTSMAAPIVTGAVALIKSVQPDLTTGQIAELLRATALTTPYDIGPILQLDAALYRAASTAPQDLPDPNADTPREETLPPSAPQFPGGPLRKPTLPGNNQDTLKLGDEIGLVDLSGYWKSTSDLHSSDNNSPVELHFYLRQDGSGNVTFAESATGEKAVAPIQASLSGRTLQIEMLQDAQNSTATMGYSAYTFICHAQTNGAVADCEAILQSNPAKRLVEFNMIRITY